MQATTNLQIGGYASSEQQAGASPSARNYCLRLREHRCLLGMGNALMHESAPRRTGCSARCAPTFRQWWLASIFGDPVPRKPRSLIHAAYRSWSAACARDPPFWTRVGATIKGGCPVLIWSICAAKHRWASSLASDPQGDKARGRCQASTLPLSWAGLATAAAEGKRISIPRPPFAPGMTLNVAW
jgi:hypothetical protein